MLGVPWGAPATTETLAAFKSMLPPGAAWAAFGIGRHEFPMVAQAALLGGHVRVGIEDNVYVERGVLARDNAQLVEKARRILELLGYAIATPAQAREMLNLPAPQPSARAA